MTSRTGLEAEAISRLTVGLQPAAIRAILVQCLAGEIAPSTAVAQMLAAGGASTVSRASDRLVQDRVDELTQVFIESGAELADVSNPTTSQSENRHQARASRSQEFSDRDELRTSE